MRYGDEVMISSDETAIERLDLAGAAFVEAGRLARLGGWELEVATGSVRWSPVLFEIFEVLPGSTHVDDAIGFYHLDDQPIITAALREAIDHQVPYDLEVRIISAQGTHLHVRTTGRPVVEGDEVVRLWGFLQDVSDRVERETELLETATRLIDAYSDTILALTEAIGVRDPYTAQHQRRVAQLAVAIGESMGLSTRTIDGLRFGAMLHDLGKISIPLEILTRPRKLSMLEHEMVKAHSQIGAEIIGGVDYPWPVIDIVRHHHERLDGSGYPDALRGDEISLEARIVAVADVVEAMASHRPYRAALGIDKALEEINQHRDVLYDADVVNACVRLFREENFEFDLT